MSTHVLKYVGAKMREHREAHKMRAPEMAARLGCDVSHYYGIERGAHPPSFELLVAIAQVLRVGVGELFPPREAKLADLAKVLASDDRRKLLELVKQAVNAL